MSALPLENMATQNIKKVILFFIDFHSILFLFLFFLFFFNFTPILMLTICFEMKYNLNHNICIFLI